MRVAITADLHYEHSDASRRGAAEIARELCQDDADVLVIAGDTFAHDLATLEACLRLFDDFKGPKCIVAGNHDLWVDRVGDSQAVYEHALPATAERCEFHYLDQGPLVVGHVAIAGNMGWYDYSFSDPRLGMPRRFYERKLGPRLAAAMCATRHMVGDLGDVPPAARQVGCVWNDGRFVRWQHTDEDMSRQLAQRLRRDLDEVAPRVDAILCVTHHIPFENMVLRHEAPERAFTNAFMGSSRLGEAMLPHPKVRFAVCGHSHRPGRFTNGHIQCINVGSTYSTKRVEIVEL